MPGIKKNGDYLLTFITEQGGIYQTHRLGEDALIRWRDIRDTGEYRYYGDHDPPNTIVKKLVFAALSKVVDNYDFDNGSARLE